MENWFEIVALSNKDDAEVQVVEGSQLFIRGGFENVIIVQVPNDIAISEHSQQILRSIEALMNKAGIKKDVMVVPQSLEFCRFKLVTGELSTVLEKRFSAKQMAMARAHAVARKKIKEAANEGD